MDDMGVELRAVAAEARRKNSWDRPHILIVLTITAGGKIILTFSGEFQ